MTRLGDILHLLACPAQVGEEGPCGGAIQLRVDGALGCGACGASYAVEDGVPILIPPSDSRPRSVTWERQRAYFDVDLNSEYEIERPEAGGRFYSYLLHTKFQRALGGPLVPPVSAPVLDACCGSGILAEYLAYRTGQLVVGFDFSFGAVRRACERARRRGYEFVGLVGDADSPPFRTGGFPLVAVHDALHHLEHPLAALSRLCNLSSDVLVVMEPCTSWLTNVAVRLGFSTDVEEAGNAVRRFCPAEFEEVVRQAGFRVTSVGRYVMYYPHQPGRLFRVLDHSLFFSLGRLVVSLGGVLGRAGGNKVHAVARR